MPNATKRANAPGLPSRRLALATLAGAGGALAMPNGAKATPATTVQPLWLAFLRARGSYAIAWKSYCIAQRRLPWWALPGPSFMNSDGEIVGLVTGWPAIQNIERPSGRILRQVRVSPPDIEDTYRAEHIFGEEMARDRRNQRMEALNERLRQQKAEQVRAGLPELSEPLDIAVMAIADAREAIEDLAPTTLDVLAARILVDAVCENSKFDTVAKCYDLDRAAQTLRALLPHIGGEIARDAAEIVGFPNRPLEQMRAHAGLPVGSAL